MAVFFFLLSFLGPSWGFAFAPFPPPSLLRLGYANGSTCFPIAKVFRHPLFLNTQSATEKAKCRIESKRSASRQPKRLNEPSYNFPDIFNCQNAARGFRLSLFGPVFWNIEIRPNVRVDFWRSYLGCAVRPSTPSVLFPRRFAPLSLSLWPSSSPSSSSNRIHCPSFGVWRWGRRTNGLWRQPVSSLSFFIPRIFILPSQLVRTPSPYLRPTTFG